MILITGASKGIGKYLYETRWYEDEVVFGTYNKTANQFALAKKLFRVDITNIDMILEWMTKVKALETPDVILINNAGINYNSFAHKADADKWCEVIHVNLIGTFNVIKTILPHMREVGYGRIINISSVVGQKGVMGTSAYAASKSGLSGMTRAIAVENAKKGITINNINLGYVNAGMTTNEIPKDKLHEISEQIPIGELIDLESVLDTIQYIIDSPCLTGTSIDLNGGLV